MSKNLRGLSSRRGLTDSLYDTIAGVSADGGADGKLIAVADEFMTGHAAVLSAASCYDFLQPSHHGKKVFMCDGTACLTSGKSEKVRQILLEKYREDEIGLMTCLGHCHSNDAFLVNGEIRLIGSGGQPETMRVSSNADMPALITPAGAIKEYYSLAYGWTGKEEEALSELEEGLDSRSMSRYAHHAMLHTAKNTLSATVMKVTRVLFRISGCWRRGRTRCSSGC
jgi:hypothetical protein